MLFKTKLRKTPGFLSVVFASLYAVFRFIVEFFREPDFDMGFIIFSLTMGQLLSIAMIIASIIFFFCFIDVDDHHNRKSRKKH